MVSCSNTSTDINNNSNSDTANPQLTSVLKNETAFITQDGETTYLKDFVYGSDEATNYYAKPQEYTLIDLNGDGMDELVADITPNKVYYMVFHNSGDDIYGFLISRRSLQSLKEDGSFKGTGGANVNYYCKMDFENNTYKIINTAISDGIDSIYEIDEKNVQLMLLTSIQKTGI